MWWTKILFKISKYLNNETIILIGIVQWIKNKTNIIIRIITNKIVKKFNIIIIKWKN
jgi:hypothetical protein